MLKKVGRRAITILDPAVGERRLPLAEVSRHFIGVVLELTPNADFKQADPRQRVALSAFTGNVLGLKRSLLQIFALVVVLVLFVITSPMLNQLVVDDAIATHDTELLIVLVVGFALLMLIQTGKAFKQAKDYVVCDKPKRVPLADLYNPPMPAALLKAHRALDAAVDAAYALNGGKKSWKTDAERVAFLFTRYEALTNMSATE